MRRVLLCLLCACSTPSPSNDGGPDASPGDSIADDSPADSPAADAPSDGSSCNVTAAETITGTFSGLAFNAQDSFATESHTTEYQVFVAITDFKGACAIGNGQKASSKWFMITFVDNSPIVPATIDITQTNGLTVLYM